MPDPSIITCPEAALVKPRYTRVEGKPVLTKFVAVAVPQTASPVVEFVIRDSEGRPVNLTSCGFGSTSSSSSTSSSAAAEGSIKLRLNETFAHTDEGMVETDAVVMDAPSGTVRVRIPKKATELAGIMNGDWGVFAPDGDLLFTNGMYVLVEANQFAQAEQSGGVPSVSEIRTYLRDHKDGNFLLKDYEWDLAEIVEAMTAAIHTWNKTPPRLTRMYNSANFYDPYALIDGIMAELYSLAAKHYSRDHLPYSAGGVQLDDKNKAQEYLAVAQELEQSYLTWVKMEKARINRMGWTGTHGSPYGGRR
jgi:hypothetical protein